jgi:hypothetical protein
MSATPNASAHVSTTTRLLGNPFKYFFSDLVGHRSSATIVPSAALTQICDSLPPRSIAI